MIDDVNADGETLLLYEIEFYFLNKSSNPFIHCIMFEQYVVPVEWLKWIKILVHIQEICEIDFERKYSPNYRIFQDIQYII